jgi:L-threonylcarbamoyladenylate synthase
MPITPILSANSPDTLDIAIKCLIKNGVIIFPTDTVYGIGCSAFQSIPIERIFTIKGRDSSKALPILIGCLEQMHLIAEPINQNAEILMQTFWPGPLTIIVLRNKNLPNNLSPYPTVGVRMPNHPWLLEVLRRFGPLASTSANPSGSPEARNVKEVVDGLDGKIDLIIDGGQSELALPSTVVDCHSTEIKILREGPIKSEEIFKCRR